MTRRRASFRSELPVERNWPSKVRTVIRIAREETVSKLIACRALEKSEIAVQSYFDPILAADSDGAPRAAITALLHVLCPNCFLNAMSLQERISYASVRYGMDERFSIRADTGIFAVLFVIGLSASLPAGVLYWLMRPTVLPNPGMSAYRPPRPDPLFPIIARHARDPYAPSIAAAKRQNELVHSEPAAAFASAQDTKPAAEVLASPTIRQQKHQRSARTQGRHQSRSIAAQEPATPLHSLAIRDHAFATWYR